MTALGIDFMLALTGGVFGGMVAFQFGYRAGLRSPSRARLVARREAHRERAMEVIEAIRPPKNWQAWAERVNASNRPYADIANPVPRTEAE